MALVEGAVATDLEETCSRSTSYLNFNLATVRRSAAVSHSMASCEALGTSVP